jgi:hypothetical protein
MDAVEREKRVTALTAELGQLAGDLAEQASNVQAAEAAGDAAELHEAAETLVWTSRHFAEVYRSLRVIRPQQSPHVGFEMSDT